MDVSDDRRPEHRPCCTGPGAYRPGTWRHRSRPGRIRRDSGPDVTELERFAHQAEDHRVLARDCRRCEPRGRRSRSAGARRPAHRGHERTGSIPASPGRRFPPAEGRAAGRILLQPVMPLDDLDVGRMPRARAASPQAASTGSPPGSCWAKSAGEFAAAASIEHLAAGGSNPVVRQPAGFLAPGRAGPVQAWRKDGKSRSSRRAGPVESAGRAELDTQGPHAGQGPRVLAQPGMAGPLDRRSQAGPRVLGNELDQPSPHPARSPHAIPATERRHGLCPSIRKPFNSSRQCGKARPTAHRQPAAGTRQHRLTSIGQGPRSRSTGRSCE